MVQWNIIDLKLMTTIDLYIWKKAVIITAYSKLNNHPCAEYKETNINDDELKLTSLIKRIIHINYTDTYIYVGVTYLWMYPSTLEK